MVARLTIKLIENTISKLTGIKVEYIKLSRFDGEYTWGGKSGVCFSEMTTHYSTLGNLERFIDSYTYALSEWDLEINGQENRNLLAMGSDMNSYIESIDWDVDYE